MTDPVSTEGLREALDALEGELGESPLPGARYALTVVRGRRAAIERATLRDTGPRPDSGIEALAPALDRVLADAESVGIIGAGVLRREIAARSTPRTETSDDS